MKISLVIAVFLSLHLIGSVLSVHGQMRPDPKAIADAQRESMKVFSVMDGTWKGEAWTLLPSGERHVLTQTERVGSFLDGTLKVVEGKGFDKDGAVSFNAFGIISYDVQKKGYSIRSYAQGNAGDFPITLTEDGYFWEINAGPVTIKYNATFKDGTWTEVGDRIIPGRDPMRIFEMTLKRVGDTDWPAAGAMKP
ncbi:MAG: DUF1579 domain-containing protein [Acidobacteriota bacterium]|nr:MAG: DUF1579 domain-containing protein [Acidobacteriota bacterium]